MPGRPQLPKTLAGRESGKVAAIPLNGATTELLCGPRLPGGSMKTEPGAEVALLREDAGGAVTLEPAPAAGGPAAGATPLADSRSGRCGEGARAIIVGAPTAVSRSTSAESAGGAMQKFKSSASGDRPGLRPGTCVDSVSEERLWTSG